MFPHGVLNRKTSFKKAVISLVKYTTHETDSATESTLYFASTFVCVGDLSNIGLQTKVL